MKRTLSAVGPAAILVAIAVWEIVATARAGGGVPGPGAWERASEAVRADFRSGELIVFAPGWIDPVGREHLGDLIPIEAAARMDGERYGGIWELSIRGARAPETRGLAPVSTQDFGGVVVRHFEREPVHVVTDFLALPPPGPGRLRLVEVGFAPHRCVQVTPPPGGTVRLDYGDVELGAELQLYAGIADVFTRRDDRSPGRLAVTIDGEPAGELTLGVEDGWVPLRVETSPGPHHVELAATALGTKSRDRRICFAAEARAREARP